MYFGKAHSKGSVRAQIDWKSVKAKMSLRFALLLLMTCKFLYMFEKMQILQNPGKVIISCTTFF